MTETRLLQELEEDWHRQRLEALWKRYGVLVLGAAAALVLGTALYSWWQSHTTTTRQKATAELLTIAKTSSQQEQLQQLNNFVTESGSGGTATLARFRAATLGTDVTAFQALADDKKLEPQFRELAVLLKVQTQMDNGDPAALLKDLEPLLEKSTWRYTAQEYAGYLALKAGDRARARDLFTKLAQEATTPPRIAERANDMMRYLAE